MCHKAAALTEAKLQIFYATTASVGLVSNRDRIGPLTVVDYGGNADDLYF
jgi:hypothetical protein